MPNRFFRYLNRHNCVRVASWSVLAAAGCIGYCEASKKGGKVDVVRVKAKLLIPGRGLPIENGMILINGNKIVHAGTKLDAVEMEKYNITSSWEAPVAMPGMWDVHVHFIGESDTPKGGLYDSMLRDHVATRAARCVAHAAKALDAGFTSVREVGGIGCHLAKLVEEKAIRGPSIYYAGQILSTTGGHGDEHDVPLECLAAGGADRMIGYLCDGVPECLKAVRIQVRNGASLIKVCTSGGVMSKVDDPKHQQFSSAELNAIVQEAARSGCSVAAHCHGKAGIKAALDAGCKTIEHGTYLDEELAKSMKSKGAILVPTRWIIESLLNMIHAHSDENLEDYQVLKLKEIADTHMEGMKLAYKMGVKIALGTDMFISTGWGFHGEECHYLEQIGMSPLEVIEAATANGPCTLGEKAPKSGILAAGYDADILVLDENPLHNISILGNPKNVKVIFKGGEVVKNTTYGLANSGKPENREGKAFAFWNRA